MTDVNQSEPVEVTQADRECAIRIMADRWRGAHRRAEVLGGKYDNWIPVLECARHRTNHTSALDEAVKALEPFVAHLDEMKFDLDDKGNELPDEQTVGWIYLTNGDFRRAAAVCAKIKESGHG